MSQPSLFSHGRANQRGAALMIIIVLLVTGIVAGLVGALSVSSLNSARQAKTSAALAQAKDALIGKSISYDDYPGSLPCPDTDNDGVSDAGGSTECPNYIGRLPWKTLGLPELRDGAGEQLWYTLSRNFRRYVSVQPLNSNTKGTLLVYGADGTSLQTRAGYDAIAVIFAAGSAIGAQTRITVADKNSASNYLDNVVFPGPVTRNNATSGGPFIAGARSDSYNDQLLFITTQNLMPLVEQRVAGVVKKALTDYFDTNGYYPWADSMGVSATYAADYGLNRGWLPDNASSISTDLLTTTPDWAAGSPPAWFFDNKWNTLIYYSAARDKTVKDSDCTSCITGKLKVNSDNSVLAMFFMPGTPIGTLTRAIDNISHYLEDPENKDDANDIYETPTSQAGDRDRLYWFSGSTWNP